jgi:DNA-directed RNA polymerase subunit E'/Rpb7
METEKEPTELKIYNTTNKKKYVKRGSNNILEQVYSKSLLSRNVNIPIVNIGKNFTETIETMLKNQLEEKCIAEGYVKKNSIRVITYSSGLIKSNVISFEVVFECLICFPVEGMLVSCVVKNITKAGIRSESSTEIPSPFILFVSRDHHHNNSYFNSLKEGDTFISRVIGQRYELNDKNIYIIGELVKPRIKT